jgi:hypothetical protein
MGRRRQVTYFDSVFALLDGHVRTGNVNVTKVFDTDQDTDFVPVLPVPLRN